MLKRYVFKCLLSIFLFNSLAYTHSLPRAPDKDEGLFVHPVSLIYGITKNEALIYATLLYPIPPISALVVHPSYLNKKDYYRIGSGLGYRLFFIDIFYAQIMPSVHYLGYETTSGAMVEVLGYVGGFGNIDVGVGYKWNFATKNHGLAVDVNFGLDATFVTIVILLPLYILFGI